jgi:penicillin-binding protein 2
VGFAPYDDPEIAVVIIVEHGGHGYFTAKTVKDIMEVYFKKDEKQEEKIENGQEIGIESTNQVTEIDSNKTNVHENNI